MNFPIPHGDLIRFVKSILHADESSAKVGIGFKAFPTFGMLIEAVAQSSSAIKTDNDKTREGVVATLKNVKLINEIKATSFLVDIELQHKVENLRMLDFKVTKDDKEIIVGSFSLVLY